MRKPFAEGQGGGELRGQATQQAGECEHVLVGDRIWQLSAPNDLVGTLRVVWIPGTTAMAWNRAVWLFPQGVRDEPPDTMALLPPKSLLVN